MRTRILTTVRALLAAAFAVTAVAKAYAPQPATDSVQHLVGLGRDSAYALVVAVIATELALAAGLTLTRRPVRWLTTAGAVITGFTVALAMLVADHTAPECGCLGKIRLWESARAANAAGLLRNGAMLLLCAVGLLASRNATRRPTDDAGPRPPRQRRSAAA